MDGPKTPSEIDVSIDPGGGSGGLTLRDLVHELQPARGNSAATRTYPPAERVLFLWGDDRQAIRKFIEVNEDYVRAVFSCEGNADILVQHWPDAHYALLCQEWDYHLANDAEDGTA